MSMESSVPEPVDPPPKVIARKINNRIKEAIISTHHSLEIDTRARGAESWIVGLSPELQTSRGLKDR
jgi:hypothetical protein